MNLQFFDDHFSGSATTATAVGRVMLSHHVASEPTDDFGTYEARKTCVRVRACVRWRWRWRRPPRRRPDRRSKKQSSHKNRRGKIAIGNYYYYLRDRTGARATTVPISTSRDTAIGVVASNVEYSETKKQ